LGIALQMGEFTLDEITRPSMRPRAEKLDQASRMRLRAASFMLSSEARA
jgi:hypothetical protein